MNKQRRSVITKVIHSLEEMLDTVQTALEEEYEAWENLPEGVQHNYRGEAMAAAAVELENAVDALGEAHSSLAEAIE